MVEPMIGNGCYRRTRADAYRPAGWLEAVALPGTEDLGASAVEFPVKFIRSADRAFFRVGSAHASSLPRSPGPDAC